MATLWQLLWQLLVAVMSVLLTVGAAADAGKERWQAWGWAAAGVLLSLGTSMMLVVVSYVHRDLETAMSGKDQGGLSSPRNPAMRAISKIGRQVDMRECFSFSQLAWHVIFLETRSPSLTTHAG